VEFAFTDEQREFQAAVRDLLAKECPPEAVRAAWSSDDGRVPGLWSQLAAMGVVGLTAPEAAGGLGMDDVDLVLLLEEVGRVALPEPVVEHTAVALRALPDEHIAAATAGELTVTAALDGVTLVPFAASADLLLLERDGGLHLVARDAVRLTPRPSVDGARRVSEVEWSPSPSTRLATGDAALAFDRGALGTAAVLLGLADRMIAMTVEHVKHREQFGVPIGSFQAVKHHLANARLELEFARPVTYRAAHSVASDDPERAVHVSIAKAFAGDAAYRASRAALQCHGAIGYSYEYDLHLWMKRAWVLGTAWGDAAWHRARVGRAIL